ncbi:MAG: hypothetical protein IT438_01715 [Phycisphaerales bacterium]|nr:hypothetical protein [Phycisphaerales bacterium]
MTASSPKPIRIGGAAGAGLQQFACGRCGARLEYVPGTKVLACPYCAHENQIPQAVDERGAERGVEELDYAATLGGLAARAGAAETVTVTDIECGACKAVFLPAAGITATACPFCGTNIVLTDHSSTVIKPGAVLPFGIANAAAVEKYRAWIRSRWFAPNKLKSRAMLEAGLKGMYVPAWTYDARTTTRYTGERGDAYYVTVGSGNSRRTERRVRWTGVSGVVADDFDDVLVMATRSLPADRLARLEPWDLAELRPYDNAYLAGFGAEAYSIDLPGGFEIAQGIMADAIRRSIRRDIGGDEQRIGSMDTGYRDITFKHILLPVWLSAYRYGAPPRTYRFLVNARTGEVQGERPYSWVKITLAALAGLVIVGVIAALALWR